MFCWTEERLGFMADACRRTDFYYKLAEELLPCLPRGARVCDAGCGLGYLSLALAAQVSHVTAVEQCAGALKVLRQEIAARGVENITPVCADVFTYAPEAPVDALVCCFFGSMEEVVPLARRLRCATVLAVVRSDDTHRFSGASRAGTRHSLQAARDYLDSHGLAYTEKALALPFHQPFRTLAAAERFAATYGGVWRGELRETGDGAFPWELPSVRECALLTLAPGRE